MMTLLKVNLSSNHTHGLLLPDTALPQQTYSSPPDVALPHKRKMPKRKSKFGKGATRGGNQKSGLSNPVDQHAEHAVPGDVAAAIDFVEF
jgi:hypothetical protein